MQAQTIGSVPSVAKKAVKKSNLVLCSPCGTKQRPSKMYAMEKELGSKAEERAICPKCIVAQVAANEAEGVTEPVTAFPLLDSRARDTKHDLYMAEKAKRDVRVERLLKDFRIVPDPKLICVDCNKHHGQVFWKDGEFTVVDVNQTYPLDFKSSRTADVEVKPICRKLWSRDTSRLMGCAIALVLNERDIARDEGRFARKIELFSIKVSLKVVAEVNAERKELREQHARRMANLNRRQSEPFHQDRPKAFRLDDRKKKAS